MNISILQTRHARGSRIDIYGTGAGSNYVNISTWNRLPLMGFRTSAWKISLINIKGLYKQQIGKECSRLILMIMQEDHFRWGCLLMQEIRRSWIKEVIIPLIVQLLVVIFFSTKINARLRLCLITSCRCLICVLWNRALSHSNERLFVFCTAFRPNSCFPVQYLRLSGKLNSKFLPKWCLRIDPCILEMR